MPTLLLNFAGGLWYFSNSMFRLYEKMSTETIRNTAAPLYLHVQHPHIQPNKDWKYLERKIQKVPKKKKKKTLQLLYTQNYLHSIHILFGIISNLEMI